jgi:hypothetical protein
MIATQFELEKFDLVTEETVHIADHLFGHNRMGKLDVWIERGDKGERFLSQLHAQGEIYAVRKEVYSKNCYILRDKLTGQYWFLDSNACGYWLQNASFYGAKTFAQTETARITKWLIEARGEETESAYNIM